MDNEMRSSVGAARGGSSCMVQEVLKERK
jgi:hypothetical protein